MEYNKATNIQAKNITEIIKEQNEFLKNIINSTDKFFIGCQEHCPKEKIFVAFRGNETIHINGDYYIFKRIQISQYARKNYSIIKESSENLLKELLEAIKIERIIDEDGCNGIFVKKIKDGNFIKENHAYCYINPFIPNGYWENHILETKFISY